MGQYILCSPPAEHPYCEEKLGMRLYTAEELSYYIYHNAALIDESFIDEKLISFLEEEADCAILADKLKKLWKPPLDLTQALLLILREIGYYTEEEISAFWEDLSLLRKMSIPERCRIRADLLYASGRYEGAIAQYQSVLSDRRDEKTKPSFYVKVLQHMGVAYIRLGLRDEAMECLRGAYREEKLPVLLKQMFFLALLSGCDFPKELEVVTKEELTEWQNSYWEVQTRSQAAVQTEMEHTLTAEKSGEIPNAAEFMLTREKEAFRRMIQ